MRDWHRKVGLNIFEIIDRKKKPSALLTKQTNKDKEKQRQRKTMTTKNDESEFLTTGFISNI